MGAGDLRQPGGTRWPVKSCFVHVKKITKMTKETEEALRDSIAHWKRLSTGKARKDEGIYSEDCALCKLFFDGDSCNDGCPVKERTGFDLCRNTPWVDVDQAFYADPKWYNGVKFKKAAAAQLAFLKSLLPKPATKTKKPKPNTQ